MKTRPARISDAASIHQLVAYYAEQGLLLPRAEEQIRRHISHFLVLEEKRHIVACLSLERYGADFAEIRSIAISPERRGEGLGASLVEFARLEARRRGVARIFAVTHAAQFFEQKGFVAASGHTLTEKVKRDCRVCAKQRSCKLVAVVATVIPERVILPVLGETSPVPAC
jgi:amino-acid N-acetyltransferase